MFVSRNALILAALAGILSIAGEAGAATITQHGTICRPNTSSAAAQWGNYGINNESTTSDLSVYCPIPLNTSGGSATLSNLSVSVYDRNSSTNVTCSLIATNADGSLSGSFVIGFTSGWSGSVYTLANSFSSLSGSYFYLDCTLPAKTGNGASHIVRFSATN